MVKEWLSKIIVLGFTFLGVYSISLFLLEQIFMEHRSMDLKISIQTSKASNFILTYNQFVASDTATNTNYQLQRDEETTLRVPIPNDLRINSILIQSNEPIDLDIKEITISGGYKNINLSGEQLQQLINLKDKRSPNKVIWNESNNSAAISNQTSDPIILLDQANMDALYAGLNNPLQNAALILSILATAVVMLNLFLGLFKILSIPYDPNALFCMAFLLLIFLPFFTSKEDRSFENRTIARFPDLNVNIWKIPRMYDKYYNDHFPFRSFIAKAHTNYKLKILGVSSNPQLVRLGKEDWLFQSSDDIKAAYQGYALFTEEELERVVSKLEEINEHLNDRGTAFYFVMPPIKHRVYQEYLPDALRIIGSESKRSQLLNRLKEQSNIRVIDPLPVILNQKDSTRVYYKSDTHWNQIGAFAVYQQIINRLKKDSLIDTKTYNLLDYQINSSWNATGNLMNMLYIDSDYGREQIFLSPKYNEVNGTPKNGLPIGEERSYLYFQNDSSKQPRLLMYRDSFTEYLFPHLSQHFSYSGYAWDLTLNKERINRADPDIVILEAVEVVIDHMLTDDLLVNGEYSAD